MENRYNVQLIVPCLYMTYDILIPVNKNIAEIITVIIKGLKILTNSNFSLNQKMHLYMWIKT